MRDIHYEYDYHDHTPYYDLYHDFYLDQSSHHDLYHYVDSGHHYFVHDVYDLDDTVS